MSPESPPPATMPRYHSSVTTGSPAGLCSTNPSFVRARASRRRSWHCPSPHPGTRRRNQRVAAGLESTGNFLREGAGEILSRCKIEGEGSALQLTIVRRGDGRPELSALLFGRNVLDRDLVTEGAALGRELDRRIERLDRHRQRRRGLSLQPEQDRDFTAEPAYDQGEVRDTVVGEIGEDGTGGNPVGAEAMREGEAARSVPGSAAKRRKGEVPALMRIQSKRKSDCRAFGKSFTDVTFCGSGGGIVGRTFRSG